MPASRRARRRTGTLRKSPTYYLLPLGISIGIVVLFTVVFNVYTHFQAQQEQALKSEPLAQITIENDETSIIFNNERNRVDRGYRIDWNNGEGLETGEDARLFVPLATKDHMRLESNTTVFGKRDIGRSIVVSFDKGALWLKSDQTKSEVEATVIRMDHMRVPVTEQATVALSDSLNEEVLAVVSGSISVEVTNDQGGLVKTVQVGVGQQLRITSGQTPGSFSDELEAIPVAFRESDWFTWNMDQDQKMATYEGTLEEGMALIQGNPNAVTFSNINAKATFRDPEVTLKGEYDADQVTAIRINGTEATLNEASETWMVTVDLGTTGTHTLRTTYTAVDGSDVQHSTREVLVDDSAPEVPTLTSPSQTQVTNDHVTLQGTVGEGTARVVVNNYALQKFSSGDTTWTYYLNAGDNMAAGANTYRVVAYDDVGNASEPLEFVITYTPTEKPAATSTNTNASSATTAPATTRTQSTQSQDNSTTAPSTSAPATSSNTAPTQNTTTPPTTNTLTPTNVRTGSGSGL